MAAKAGFPPEKTVEVYDSWYGLAQNPYKKDTETVRREAAGSDLVLGKAMINLDNMFYQRENFSLVR